jgi:PqqD family protein of HPr-rel-A system
MSPSEETMGKQSHLRDLAISESGFVFDPVTGATFTVNPTGLAILQALRAGGDRAALIAAVSAAFETEGLDVTADVDEFLQQLERHDVLSHDSARELGLRGAP